MLVSRQVAPDYRTALPQAPRRQAQPPRLPRERTAVRPDPTARRAALARWTLAGVLWLGVVALGLLYVHGYDQAVELGFRMNEQRQQVEQLQWENEQLLAEVNELRALSRISAVAMAPVEQGGLGMVRPENVQIAVVDPNALAPLPSVALAGEPLAQTAGEPGLWDRLTGWAAGLGFGPARAEAAGR